VKNELHTISIGQTILQDSVKKSGLRHNVFDKSCLRRIFCHKKIWPAAHFFYMTSSPFRQNLTNPRTLIYMDLTLPSSKGTKVLFQVIKSIINQLSVRDAFDFKFLILSTNSLVV